MVIKNPEEVNAAIVNGKQSKEYFHRVTGHAGHHLMDATAIKKKVDLTGKVNNYLSCSLEKMDRSQNISLHFIYITFHLHYITFAFKTRATSARNA